MLQQDDLMNVVSEVWYFITKFIFQCSLSPITVMTTSRWASLASSSKFSWYWIKFFLTKFEKQKCLTRESINGAFHQPYFFSKSPVLFLIRVKAITTRAMIQGGKFKPEMFNFWTHCGGSLKTKVIKTVITATPSKIFVTGWIKESLGSPSMWTVDPSL